MTLDEGVKIVAYHISQRISKNHVVLKLDVRYPNLWKLSQFKPQIIHFVLSPTYMGLISTKIISAAQKSARTVMSALHPFVPNSAYLTSRLKPDVVLVQSLFSQQLFSKLGFETCFLPNGVDVERFQPCSQQNKAGYREKFGLKKDAFIMLHVGPIKRGRNLELLSKLATNDELPLVVGRTYRGIDWTLYSELQQNCRILTEYMSNIEEIYGLSDSYVFSTQNRENCIETPLSVLEAMSCNLPVVTTRFGSLPRMLNEGSGLFFVESFNEFSASLARIKEASVTVRTREKVLPYSWDNIIQRLNEIYESFI